MKIFRVGKGVKILGVVIFLSKSKKLLESGRGLKLGILNFCPCPKNLDEFFSWVGGYEDFGVGRSPKTG